MNDNTRDVTMSLEKTQQLVQRFIIAPALYTTIVIVQFVARMHKANLLKKTDWENFDKFTKFCEYNFEVADLPLSKRDLEAIKEQVDERLSRMEKSKGITTEQRRQKEKELIKEGIKEKLDNMGIHYCMMDNDFDEEHIKIYYAKSDKPRFENFLGSYIRDHLVSGEMTRDELKNMMGDKVTIVSVPDELEEKLQDAMAVVDVSFAKIEDLNLADGKKQMYVPNHQLQTVSQLYSEIRNGLIASGLEDPGPMEEMTQEELNATAICQDEQEFVDRCDEKHQEVSDSFIDENSKNWKDVSERFEPLGSKSSVEYLQSDLYEEISIDEETLVAGEATKMTNSTVGEAMFACRVPGTWGNDVRYLVVPKDRVFKDTYAQRTRYVAFLDKGKKNIVLDATGKPVKDKFTSVETLMKHFDKKKGADLAAPLPNLTKTL